MPALLSAKEEVMKTYRVTLVHYDKEQNFTYVVEAGSPWEAFLAQPRDPNLEGPPAYKTWTVEEVVDEDLPSE